MVGALLFCLGTVTYLFGVVLVVPRLLLGDPPWLLAYNDAIVWYSGAPVAVGIVLILFDLFVLLDAKRRNGPVRFDSFPNPSLTVVLTAYNDELSIGEAVRDFIQHPRVGLVIVVSNNSSDRTFEVAQAAGALTFNEPSPGYGQCVFRSLTEALRQGSSDLIVLCEGDCTFRAYDIDKFLAYAPHADIVNGTRTVERLREHNTQLSTFMYYGNLFVAKLLEIKHIGKSTITDVGTTYKLCRRSALEALLPRLDPRINLEFNAYFLDKALESGLFLVECPITFHRRVGVSKGGNTNNLRALKVGLRMIGGIMFNWRGQPR